MTESVRYTVNVQLENQAKLAALAKTYKLSQGDVIDVLVEQANAKLLHQALVAKKGSKVENRGRTRDWDKAIGSLSPVERELLIKKLQQG